MDQSLRFWCVSVSTKFDFQIANNHQGTAIGAVNNADHLRVYTQDVLGNIRESLFEGGWVNGTSKNVIAQGKLGSPLAATSKALNEVSWAM